MKKQGSMFGWICDPGKYLFLIGCNGEIVYIPVELSAGRTYYVAIDDISFNIAINQIDAVQVNIELIVQESLDSLDLKKIKKEFEYMMQDKEDINKLELTQIGRIKQLIKDYYWSASESKPGHPYYISTLKGI